MNNRFLHHCLDIAIEVHPLLLQVQSRGDSLPAGTLIEITPIIDLLKAKGFAESADGTVMVPDIMESIVEWLSLNLVECGAYDFAHHLYHLFAEGDTQH